ncbi:type II toxin-antitoxin system PemK/MazF family toxin [Cellulomonas sp. NS3]|uniref:type II toxin-antitoxin system PemK/MazF family toxin n=1 Tax=Cellulomonas sp. NS3 TaxID=2973977 RepID=UPI0021628E01|nr:type II toxin-antitoxin system PemK/MazF family toxin [Cellulomonas sp. NS3]
MRGRTWVRVLDAVLRAVTSGGGPGASGSGSGRGGTSGSATQPPARRAPLRRTRTTADRPAADRGTAARGGGDAGRGAQPAPAPRSGRERSAARPEGDYTGVVRPQYSPDPDGRADPGEIVWTWVPYEDDPSQGKDRPVLLVGRDGPDLLGLMLTSKDHSRDAADEARWGRVWLDIGAGDWDSRRRPSEVRLDRVLRVDPDAVRREGAVMQRAQFDRVTGSLAEHHGW